MLNTGKGSPFLGLCHCPVFITYSRSNPPFLHTISDLNLDDEKAWEYAKGIQCTLCALMSREEKCLEILFHGYIHDRNWT